MAFHECWKPQLIITYVPNNSHEISKCLCSLDKENKGPSLLETEGDQSSNNDSTASTNISKLVTDEASVHWGGH